MELIKRLGTRFNSSKIRKDSYGLFLCSYCNKEVERNLSAGKTCKSCGCVKNKLIGEAKTKHGDSINSKYNKLYGIWDGMKRMCYNKNHHAYKNYGGRRIVVCRSWKFKYTLFKKWALANGYKEDLTIDRINNNGNYEPDNCRWTTRKEQNRNTRYNKLIKYNNKIHCIGEWAEILGMKDTTLRSRIHRGWSIKKIFTAKIRIYKRGE